MEEDKFTSLLGMGVARWNEWRAEHPTEKVELGGWRGEYLNLRNVDLSGSDFHDCTFVYTCMDGAKLGSLRPDNSRRRGTLLDVPRLETETR
jgi:hypothetical protein